MGKTMRVSYKDALDAAYEHWAEFYDESDKYDAVKRDHSRDWREMALRDLQCHANAACTAEWMLCDMFGLSEDRVHGDLMVMRATKSACRG